MNYWFLYDTSTGKIYPSQSDNAPSQQNMGVLGPYDQSTASPTVVMAYTYPERYLAQGSPVALVEQPYFTVAAVESATVPNQWAITVTLNNPPAQPPANVTIAINGADETVALTTVAPFTATLTVNVHASLVNAPITAAASAASCATSRPMNIGGSTQSPVATQVYTPTGGVPTVAPTGAGSKGYLQAYYTGLMAPAQEVADLATLVGMLTQTLYGVVLPALTSGATPIVTLDADAKNALTDITNTVLPSVKTTLENAAPQPAAGAAQTFDIHYGAVRADYPTVAQALGGFATDMATIPNLA